MGSTQNHMNFALTVQAANSSNQLRKANDITWCPRYCQNTPTTVICFSKPIDLMRQKVSTKLKKYTQF